VDNRVVVFQVGRQAEGVAVQTARNHPVLDIPPALLAVTAAARVSVC
jgi:hypothetical protein